MPSPSSVLVENPSPLIERGQNVLDGDITVLAGTRIARINGLISGTLTNMPAGTLFGNLFDTDEPGFPFDANIIAGDGLTYDLDIKNGPFPVIIAESAQAFPASSTTMNVVLPGSRKAKDKIIIGTQHNGANTVTTPSGWTLLGNIALADSSVNVYERILDGTETSPLTITASIAGATLAKVWVVRYSSDSLHSQVVTQSNTSTSGTSNDVGSLTPTWGIANTLWLTFIGIEADDPSPPNITAFPTGFGSTGELQNASATAALDGAIGWGAHTFRGTSLDPTAYTYAASRSGAFLIAVPPRVAGAINVIPGGGTVGWDDTLLVDNHSGASNPIIDDAQYIQFGIATPPATGQIRTDNIFLLHGTKDVGVTAGEAIDLLSFDNSTFICTAGGIEIQCLDLLQLTSTSSSIVLTSALDTEIDATRDVILKPSRHLTLGDGTLTDDGAINVNGTMDINSTTDVVNILGATGFNLTATSGAGTLDAATVNLPKGFLLVVEKAASTPVLTAGQSLFWTQSLTPNKPMFTDDTNVDFRIALLPLGLADLATQATDTFIANVSGATATPTAVNISTLAGAGLVFGTHTLDVTAGAGGSIVVTANDVQRGALTGAITASQDSNTTAFGALSAKSVLANATNASAVPAALAGSAAFQHLRVNSGNTGLEWSVFTAGDFPAAVVPLTALATQATDTFVANVSGSTASPVAVNLSTLAGAGLVFGTHTLDVTAGAGASLVVSANDIQRGALTGAISAAQDSNATLFAGIHDNSVSEIARNVLNFLSTTSITASISDTGVGGELQIFTVRAALTGDITAGSNSNTTAFRSFAAKSILANATNASAVPSDLAGSAAFQHLRVNSGNTGLEWSVFTAGDFPAGVVPLTALATQATDTFVANVSGATATPVAVNLSTLAGAGLVFGTHTLDVTAGAGGSLVVSANDIQRAALTGAITASQDSNTTAFGALAAKSVLANATNASAVPAALAGSAAFQHLRVNSGNTGLEWSVFTAGDFPAGVVPLTALATQAAHTFVANNTAGVASPIAITAAQATAELDVFTSTLKGLAPLSGGGTVNFLRADGTWAAPSAALPSVATDTFLGNISGVTATAAAVLLSAIDSASIIYDATSHTFQAAALTGAITAAQNSTTTAFGALAAKSVLANATNASAVPAALAGSAAFQHLRVNSGNTGLEWSVLTTGDFPANSVPISAFPTGGPDVFVGNTSGTGTLSINSFSAIDSTSVVYDATTHTFQRGALTGAITASQNSNTTAFGALAAKSVLANATNASAVPAALAGSAAFQHLRVNSGNTGLEWSVLTTSDFPSNSVPLTALPTIAPGTLLGVRGDVSATTPTAQLVNDPISIGAGGVTIAAADNTDISTGIILVNGGLSTRPSPSRYEWRDDFNCLAGISITTGGAFQSTSEGSWFAQAAGAAGSTTVISGISAHPGQLLVTTGAASGNNVCLVKASSATAVTVIGSDLDYMCFTLSISSVTSILYAFGFCANFTTLTTGIQSLYLYISNGALHSYVDNVTGHVDTNLSTTIAINVYHRYEIKLNHNTSNFEFYVDGTLKGTTTTNVPTTGGGSIGIGTLNTSAAAKSFTVDYVGFQSNVLFR